MSKLCIGLFGTCGDSTWRQDLFIPQYESRGMVDGVDFFNPQVDDWKPELADIEADHLATDAIICFPVLSETYGLGSLAETGFSIAQALKWEVRRDIIVLVDPDVNEALKEADEKLAKESLKARKLVRSHMGQLKAAGVFWVESLEHMLHISLNCFNAKRDLANMRRSFCVG